MDKHFACQYLAKKFPKLVEYDAPDALVLAKMRLEYYEEPPALDATSRTLDFLGGSGKSGKKSHMRRGSTGGY